MKFKRFQRQSTKNCREFFLFRLAEDRRCEVMRATESEALGRLFRRLMCRISITRDASALPCIEAGAFVCQHFAVDLKIVAKCIADEVDDVGVARFKINSVHIVPTRSVHDAADSHPKARHSAHSAY